MDYRLRMLDWHSDTDKEDVTRLFTGYTEESWTDGGSGDGFAVAYYLQTVLASVQGHTVAVYSYDPTPRDGSPAAIEMIYVEPAYRRRGIASSLVSELQSRVPDVQLKSPLTPACAAMAERVGVLATCQSPDELAQMAKNTREIRAGRTAYCAQQGHRRAVAFQACARCETAFPRLVAKTQVDQAFEDMRQVDPLAAWQQAESMYAALPEADRQAVRVAAVNGMMNVKAVLDRAEDQVSDGSA